MKPALTICFFLFLSVCMQAQFVQKINKTSGTATNVLNDIDSITFPEGGTRMDLALSNGNTASHLLSSIVDAEFGTIGQTMNACGADSVTNPGLVYGFMRDQDHILYKTIRIGNQVWMAENLRAVHYRNGAHIPQDLYFWYLNDSATYACARGLVYSSLVTLNTSSPCPKGWHLPNNGEWQTLIDTLGSYWVAGGKLKSAGYAYWPSPNVDGSNESGFSAVPCGYNGAVMLNNLRVTSGFWSSSVEVQINLIYSYYLGLSTYWGNTEYNFDRGHGNAIRCVKDE